MVFVLNAWCNSIDSYYPSREARQRNVTIGRQVTVNRCCCCLCYVIVARVRLWSLPWFEIAIWTWNTRTGKAHKHSSQRGAHVCNVHLQFRLFLSLFCPEKFLNRPDFYGLHSPVPCLRQFRRHRFKGMKAQSQSRRMDSGRGSSTSV